jgi:hypothetical protein
MDPASGPEQIRHKMTRGLKALWGGIVSIFSVLLILLLWSANFSSCIKGDDSARAREAKKLKIVQADGQNERHAKIQHALQSVWFGATGGKDGPKLFVVDSRDINAASFGYRAQCAGEFFRA